MIVPFANCAFVLREKSSNAANIIIINFFISFVLIVSHRKGRMMPDSGNRLLSNPSGI
jgi:hypothetical protein